MFRLGLHWQILIAVATGALAGLALNATASHRTTETTIAEDRVLRVRDSTDHIDIQILDASGRPIKKWIIDPTGRVPGSVRTLSELKEKDARAYELFHAHGRSTARWLGDAANAAGGLFLRMLKMVSIPLVVASLLTGVLGLASAARLGKMFLRTGAYYLATSLLAILTGLLLVNLIRPGARSDVAPGDATAGRAGGELGSVLYQQLEMLIPDNPVAAAASGNFLSVIAFTLAFGIFAVLAGGKTTEVIRELAQAMFSVMMAMTMAIIRLAPLGVFFLMLYATATQGAGVFRTLGWYLLTVACGLLIHAAVTLPLIVRFVAGRSPLAFAKAMSPALLTAFSSASSSATLPLTMTSAEQRAGISNRVGSFVLPLGATLNMDGTALFEVVAVLFIVQLEPGITLSLAEQVIVVVTALLASIGAAGIPHAGLVMMVIILQAVGLPTDKVGLILAVDRILDMCRTSVNVWSDACGCAVLARFEADEPSAVVTPPKAQS